MKKLLLLLLMIGVGLASFATNYDIWVGGQRVTSSNNSNISGGNYIKSGYATYDPTNKILHLYSIVINNTETKGDVSTSPGIRINESGVVIYYHGTNSITAASEAGLHASTTCTLQAYTSSSTILFKSTSSTKACGVGCYIADGKTLTINPSSTSSSTYCQYGSVTLIGDYGGLWGDSDGGKAIINGGFVILKYNSSTANYKPCNGVALTLNNGEKLLNYDLYYSSKYLYNVADGSKTTKNAMFQSTCGVCVKGTWMPYYNDGASHSIIGTGTGTLTYQNDVVTMNNCVLTNSSTNSYDPTITSSLFNFILLPNITKLYIQGTNNLTTSNGAWGILLAGQKSTSELLFDGQYAECESNTLKITGMQSYGRPVALHEVYLTSDWSILNQSVANKLSLRKSEIDITKGASNICWLQGWSSIALDNCKILLPDQGSYNTTSKVVVTSGNSTATNTRILIAPIIGLKICNTEVTYLNRNAISGTGISGTVKYDVISHKLSLNGATLTNSASGGDVISNTGVEKLTINLTGINTITAGDDAYNNSVASGVTNFNGTGTLNAKGFIYASNSGQTINISGGCTVNQHTSGSISGQNYTLTVNNSTLKATSIKALASSPTLTGVLITAPAGAAYNNNQIELNGSQASGVVIEPATGYDLWVGGVQVHSKNASAVTGKTISGTVSYNATSKILTLNGATITNAYGNAIKSSISGLTVSLTGTNFVSSTSSSNGAMALTGAHTISGNSSSSLSATSTSGDGIYITSGSLTVKGGTTLTTVSNATSNCSGIYGQNSYKLIVDNSVVKATASSATSGSISGFASIDFVGTKITTPSGASYNTTNHRVELSGSLVKSQVIIEPAYDLWVSGVQVVQSNINKITGSGISGTISYTPSTKTLTLSSATINFTSSDGILSQMDGLNIQLTGTNYIKGTSGDGIDFCGNTTIKGTGSLNISGSKWGLFATKSSSYSFTPNLTISGGCVIDINCSSYGVACANAPVKIDNSEVRALASSISFSAKSLNLVGVDIAQPAGATFNSTSSYIVDANGSAVKTQVIIKKVTKYTITAVANNSSWGSVSGGGSYAENSYIDLVATANSGYHFVKWADDNSTSPTRTVKVTANKTYTANFEANAPDQYTITVKSANPAWGTVSGGGTYAANSTQTIKATPNTGYDFVKWDDGDLNATRSIKVTANKTYTASFKAKQFTLTLKTNNSNWGTVTGGGTYDYNTNVTCEAVAKTGYEFVEWSDGNKSATRIINITKAETLTATFQPKQYLLTAVPNDVEMGNVTGGGYYDYNTNATLSAEANYGYKFVEWTDGVKTSSRQVKVTKDETYTANFEISQFEVSLSSNNEEWGTVTGAGNYDYKSTATISAIPNKGFYFVKWSDDDSTAVRDIVVTENVNLTAIFASSEADKVTVTVLANDETMGYVTGSGVYAIGEEFVISASANTGYKFVKWSDDNQDAVRTLVASENVVYTAIFDTLEADKVIITVLSSDESKGLVTGGGEFAVGSQVTIKAVAFPGYKFVKWDDDCPDAIRTLVVNESGTFIALFEDDVEEGIEDAEANNFIVFARHADIVVRNAERNQIAIFDVNGKLIYLQQGNGADENVFTMPSAGVYFVKIGATTAKKVVVLK